MVTEAHTQTLSNKTFVAPVLGAATATSLALGTNPASANALRVANAAGLSTRNNGNSNDYLLIGSNSGDGIAIGQGTVVNTIDSIASTITEQANSWRVTD